MGQTTSQPEVRNVAHLSSTQRSLDSSRNQPPGIAIEDEQSGPSNHYYLTQSNPSSRAVPALSRHVSTTSITAIGTSNTRFTDEHISQGDASYEPHITHISASPLPHRSRRSRLNSAITSLPARFKRTDSPQDQDYRRSSILGRFSSPSAGAFPSGRGEQWSRHDATGSSPHIQETPSSVQRSATQRLEEQSGVSIDTSRNSIVDSPHLRPYSISPSLGTDHIRQGVQEESHGDTIADYASGRIESETQQSGHSVDAQLTAGLNASARPDEGASNSHRPDPSLVPSQLVRSVLDEHIHNGPVRRQASRNSTFMQHLDLRDILRSTSGGTRNSLQNGSYNDNTPLSQLMNATALAIATQISQISNRPGDDRSVPTPEVFDALFQPVQQALQSLVRNRHDSASENHSPTSTSPLRVFRLGSRTPRSATPAPVNRDPSRASVAPNIADQAPNTLPSERLPSNVTVVVVAFRSAVAGNPILPSSRRGSLNSNNSLLTLSPLNESNAVETGSSNEPGTRRSSSRSTFTQLRRATQLVNPSNLEWLQSRTSNRRRMSRSSTNENVDRNFSDSSRDGQSALEDSPPGPIPPPSTPAEHAASATSSGSVSPSRRQSILASFQNLHLNSHFTQDELSSQDSPSSHTDRHIRSSRQRRRSESDAARHRFLGSGSSRRNGVVEPDNIDEGDEGSGRNWLIYVIGTNASGDQRAWTAPGLFSDNPSYEELLMLTSLLGPVKPPVASSADLASAGGLYNIVKVTDAAVIGSNMDNNSELQIAPLERCWICLESYEMGENARQLRTCSHVFHQGCIDEWLTTGRNSCPLCREEGVNGSRTTANQ